MRIVAGLVRRSAGGARRDIARRAANRREAETEDGAPVELPLPSSSMLPAAAGRRRSNAADDDRGD